MRLLLLSNARTEGKGYLEHATEWLREFLPTSVTEVLLVPYAGVTKMHYDYVEQVSPVFAKLGASVTGLHRAHDLVAAIRSAQAIVVGGGNTWNLAARTAKSSPGSAGNPAERARRCALHRLERRIEHRLPDDHDDQ